MQIGQGVFTSSPGAVSGVSYAGGFDELRIGAYFDLAAAQAATTSSFPCASLLTI